MTGKKKALLWLLVVLLALPLAGCGEEQAPETEPVLTQGAENSAEVPENSEEPEITEEPGVPLSTKYIVLSYPAELEGEVSIRYEEIADGQEIIFSTDFTGENLELFRFSISKNGTDGYELGVLQDAEDGELRVCVDVKDYENGRWTPEQYQKINALQERVNDIIVQFHDDPRFVPVR